MFKFHKSFHVYFCLLKRHFLKIGCKHELFAKKLKGRLPLKHPVNPYSMFFIIKHKTTFTEDVINRPMEF